MNLIRVAVLLLITQTAVGTVAGADIAGVHIGGSAILADGTKLILNGAGIRRKFFANIYIGALYLPSPAHSAADILEAPPANRIYVHILHGKISREKLIQAWTEGFQRNHDETSLSTLSGRITSFNELFSSAMKGDEIVIDYSPGAGTRVSINAELKGTIKGEDFNRSLLSIWLGKKPVSATLKRQLLGNG